VDAQQGATVSEVKPLDDAQPATGLDSGQGQSLKPNPNPNAAEPQAAPSLGATGTTQPKSQTTTLPKGTPKGTQ
jgi:hypothetical protein